MNLSAGPEYFDAFVLLGIKQSLIGLQIYIAFRFHTSDTKRGLLLHMEVGLICIDSLIIILTVLLVDQVIVMRSVLLLAATVIGFCSCALRLRPLEVDHLAE